MVSSLCLFSVKLCTAVFTDLASLVEHLWTCDFRSKFMDRDSEEFVCLECGKCYKQEKTTHDHVQKHHNQVGLLTL